MCVYSGTILFLLGSIAFCCFVNAALESETVKCKSEEILVLSDLSVTGNGHDVSKQLIFSGDKAEVLVKHNDQKMIIQKEEKGGNISYKVIQYGDETNVEGIRAMLNFSNDEPNYSCITVDYLSKTTELQNVKVGATPVHNKGQ